MKYFNSVVISHNLAEVLPYAIQNLQNGSSFASTIAATLWLQKQQSSRIPQWILQTFTKTGRGWAKNNQSPSRLNDIAKTSLTVHDGGAYSHTTIPYTEARTLPRPVNAPALLAGCRKGALGGQTNYRVTASYEQITACSYEQIITACGN